MALQLLIMINTLYRHADGTYQAGLSADDIAAALADKEGLLWVDLVDEAHDTAESLLRQVFGFHPLAVDDALHETHVPKLDDWQDYLYVVLRAVTFSPAQGGALLADEVDVFLGENYLVTYHEKPIVAVDHVRSSCQRSERHLGFGPDHLLYLLADELVTEYMLVVEDLDAAIDEIETQIFDRPGPGVLASIFTLKRAVLKLRRTVSPMREVLNKLARDDYAMIDAKDRVYFRDVYDHLVRLHDINEGLRDLIGGALDTYLSVINNRMNEIVKTLTIITTLFMPLSFLAGFFGMNFFQPVERSLFPWTGETAFWGSMAIMVITPLAMGWWLRRRGWM
ncbi:MAG: magnesium/cobalt transporter CorA [Chloroflexota bacterium]